MISAYSLIFFPTVKYYVMTNKLKILNDLFHPIQRADIY